MSAIRKAMSVFVTVIFILESSLFAAEDSKQVTPTPVPVQILNAKKVFVANAPGDLIDPSMGGNERPYASFYSALKSSGQYELVSSPAEADVILEVSFSNTLTGVGGTSATGCSSSTSSLLRLVIVDPKTQTPLWWFAEPIVQKRMMFHAEKATDAFADTVPKLLDDLRTLPSASSTAPKP